MYILRLWQYICISIVVSIALSRIYKALRMFNIKKFNSLIKKWEEEIKNALILTRQIQTLHQGKKNQNSVIVSQVNKTAYIKQ